MRAPILLLSLLVSACTPAPVAAESPVVLLYGDSIPNHYFHVLVPLRPDVTLVAGVLGGDPSGNLQRFTDTLADVHPAVVILQHGTNDATCTTEPGCPVPATPDVTARNLARMARLARRTGAMVYVLTLTPAAFIWDGFCAENPTVGACAAREQAETWLAQRQNHAREVSEKLLAWRPRHGISVWNLRDEFTVHAWQPLSVDGVHPNDPGRAFLAAYVARMLPAAELLARHR